MFVHGIITDQVTFGERQKTNGSKNNSEITKAPTTATTPPNQIMADAIIQTTDVKMTCCSRASANIVFYYIWCENHSYNKLKLMIHLRRSMCVCVCLYSFVRTKKNPNVIRMVVVMGGDVKFDFYYVRIKIKSHWRSTVYYTYWLHGLFHIFVHVFLFLCLAPASLSLWLNVVWIAIIAPFFVVVIIPLLIRTGMKPHNIRERKTPKWNFADCDCDHHDDDILQLDCESARRWQIKNSNKKQFDIFVKTKRKLSSANGRERDV